ncbi:hypothetical protein A1E_02165 [Rickettsia canadensis str. McKiel]|uniref:Uncharacterized protein n=1 Tax=Rickettsia canadensis (strain McKiel) TaxID=293613 RepID=A8EYE5_RICCK|nr:hypothetical protein A1E_02165 [Rickettsia canadensis str. McKiel]
MEEKATEYKLQQGEDAKASNKIE